MFTTEENAPLYNLGQHQVTVTNVNAYCGERKKCRTFGVLQRLHSAQRVYFHVVSLSQKTATKHCQEVE